MVDHDGSRLGAEAARRLAALGVVEIAPGLTDAEFGRVETEFGFEFADDHRAFLSAGLPVGDSWPDWRLGTRRPLRTLLQWPVDGLLFGVEWKEFWDDRWGRRPARMKDALRTARYRLDRVPRMVPVFGHRFLPVGRGSFGHPVLSMYQTEIACYADDLVHYVDNEFGPEPHRPVSERPTVEFWSDLAQ
jgi:hypothetical protein